jgi:hypothetical protein
MWESDQIHSLCGEEKRLSFLLLKQVADGECTVTFVLFRYLVLWFSWYLAGHSGGITSVVVKLTALWKITDGLCVCVCVFLCQSFWTGNVSCTWYIASVLAESLTTFIPEVPSPPPTPLWINKICLKRRTMWILFSLCTVTHRCS